MAYKVKRISNVLDKKAPPAGEEAVEKVVDAIDSIAKLLEFKGEKTSSAMLIGYLSMMATRILDDIEKHKQENKK